jgi:hypothetical protein
MRQGPQFEAAAFLVRATDGKVNCYLWPRAVEPLSQTWLGEMPEGTIAIAHTHPAGYGWMPSRADRAVASATGLPIFVATLWDISKFDPVANEMRRVNKSRRWRASVDSRAARCAEPAAWSRNTRVTSGWSRRTSQLAVDR